RIWYALAAHPSPPRNGDETIGSYVARMNVELVRWPGDPQRLAGLRDRGVPRLLLVSDDADPPIPTDCLEDWVAAGAPESALDVHVLRLRRRLAPLGLEIRTVRSRGYLLQELRQTNGRTATTVTPSSRFGPL